MQDSPHKRLIAAGFVPFLLLSASLLLTSSTSAQEAQKNEPEKTPAVAPKLVPEMNLGAEYRVRTLQVNPYELSGEDVTDTTWTEQRLRLKLQAGYEGFLKLNVTTDVLDGVLWGDNGTFGQDPSSISGVALAAKRPNSTNWTVGLRPGGDPLNFDDYIPVLQKPDPIEFVHAYADVLLPIGVLRVGRQPQGYGASISTHEGTRINRWGVSDQADVVDRVLFGTKLDQAYYVATKGSDHVLDASQDRGVFLALFRDTLSQSTLQSTSDDFVQYGASLQFKKPEAQWMGLDWRNVLISVSAVNLTEDRFDSDVWGVPFRLESQIEDLRIELQTMVIRGSSREISEGFAALSKKEAKDQDIEGNGARAVLDYKIGPVTLTLEGNYASGDPDPRPSTPITQLSFARSLNVGLLLFEHILAFESARSLAVGVENLQGSNAESFPLTEVSTEGRFTNAVALFPQMKIDFVDTAKHKLHTRVGALFAWPAADGLVDPVATILGEDGNDIKDDAVNFHGGDPGDYYGTEFDLQIEWSMYNKFFWVLEGAILLPGSSLQDIQGAATDAYLLENRFVYVF